MKNLFRIQGIIFIMLVLVIWSVDFCIEAKAQGNNTLNIEYLNNFPGEVNFDSKYQEPDKYLVYKYVKFSFGQPIIVSSVGLSFLVDNDWYEENNIKDVIFLRFNNGSWTRVGYNNKTVEGNYKKYKVDSDAIGDYWAIIGVLPKEHNFVGDITNIKKINNNAATLQTVDNTKKIDEVVSIGKSIIINLQEPVNVKGASAITTTTATVSTIALLAFLGGPASLWVVLQQIMAALLGFLFSKKRYRSGVVYEAGTGAPVPLVRVDLIDEISGKIKATKFTNKNGEYYFLAPKGKYHLQLQKRGYKIVKNNKAHLLKALLQDDDIKLKVELTESGIIKKNIAILQENKLSKGTMRVFLITVGKYLANILFFAGLIISIWSCYINPVLFNFFILGVYLFIIIFKAFFTKKKKYGIIINDNKPAPFVSISVADAKTKKVISRVISDTKGRYYLLLNKGEYLLTAKTTDGIVARRKIVVKNKNVLSQKIIIQK